MEDTPKRVTVIKAKFNKYRSSVVFPSGFLHYKYQFLCFKFF